MSYPNKVLPAHPAARAGTVREGGSAQILKHPTVEIERGRDRAPYRVVHDALAHRPYGLFRVMLDGRQIGTQLSRPTPDDCKRMEREASA